MVVLLVSTGSIADSFVVSATVQNTLSVAETTALSFGTIIALTADQTNDTSATVGALELQTDGSWIQTDGVAATGDGANAAGHVSKILNILGDETVGDLTVTGGAGATVTVTSSATADLSNAAEPVITLTSITTSPVNNGVLVLDAGGAGTILVGGKITAADDVAQYAATGTWSGSYDVSVAY